MTAFLRCLQSAACRRASSFYCTSTSTKTAKSKTVETSGVGNSTGSSKLAGFVGDKGQSHVDFGEFLSLLDHESPQATRTIRDDDRRSSSARPNARKYKFPFYFSMNHHQRALLRLGITTAVRQVTPALLWKKNTFFQKILVVVVGVRRKRPSDGAQVSKRAPRHRRNQMPQSSNVWRQILQKRGKQKTLRNEHNTGKKRDNFELRTKIVPRESRPKHSGVAESLPRPQPIIHPWRIYPSYGHWEDHFDDGYIRHMALNGLRSGKGFWKFKTF